MIKKLILLFMFLLLLPLVSAFMPESHTYAALSTLRKMDTTNPSSPDYSPIAKLCKDRESQIMFGLHGTDVPVIHYLEKKLEGYKGTHSRSVYNKLLELAGSDVDLKCVAYGAGIHLIEDRVSHYELVPKYIKKYFGSNVLIHPIVEISAREQLLDRLEKNPDTTISVAEVKELTKHALDLFYEDEKYYKLFKGATGLDMRADFAMVDAALKGERWADEVYGKQVNLPNFYWKISYGFLIIGVLWLLMTAYLSKNKLGIISYIIGSILFLFGLALVISLYTGQSWIWYNNIAKIPAAVMNIEDTTIYDDKQLENTRRFLKTEQLLVDGQIVSDASGLDHYELVWDKTQQKWFTVYADGPLEEAEKRFKFSVYPAFLIFSALGTIFLFWKMSKKSMR